MGQSVAQLLQWLCLTACFCVYVWNLHNYLMLGPHTVAWEVVYVMAVVCEFRSYGIL